MSECMCSRRMRKRDAVRTLWQYRGFFFFFLSFHFEVMLPFRILLSEHALGRFQTAQDHEHPVIFAVQIIRTNRTARRVCLIMCYYDDFTILFFYPLTLHPHTQSPTLRDSATLDSTKNNSNKR